MNLIGYFDLDPDRVSNFILDAAIMNCEIDGYIYLIKKFQIKNILFFLGKLLIL